jgi:hypothetical protein
MTIDLTRVPSYAMPWVIDRLKELRDAEEERARSNPQGY